MWIKTYRYLVCMKTPKTNFIIIHVGSTVLSIFLFHSESSMFVSERRFILKTCGTTTLLLAIEPLLKLVALILNGYV